MPLLTDLHATHHAQQVFFAFGSVVVPLRAVFSILQTICWVFGFAVLVYEYNALGWIGDPILC